MALDNIIHIHLPYEEAGEHNHVSMASHRRGLESANEKIREWVLIDNTRQRIAGNLTGHVVDDQFVPRDFERIQEIRAELKGMCE